MAPGWSADVSEVVIVLTTVPAAAEGAESLARTLVAERLAACVNVCTPMASFYQWRGEIERSDERQLVIKTSRDNLQALERRLRELHPYELPEFLVLEMAGGSDAYLAWVAHETRLDR